MQLIRILIAAIVILSLLLLAGCDKEKIVNTTETIREIEYVEVPGATVVRVDTVFVTDPGNGQGADTIYITDTVDNGSCAPGEHFAFAALQYYTNPLVIEMVSQEFGVTEGWVYYLSEFQSDITTVSAGTYEIYGYIDFWTTDWSGFYPIEYLWQVTYGSGDPADPTNWQMSEPPAVSGRKPGMHSIKDTDRSRSAFR